MADNGNHINDICAIFRETNLEHVAKLVEGRTKNAESANGVLLDLTDMAEGLRTVLARQTTLTVAVIVSEYLNQQSPDWNAAHTRLKALQQRVSPTGKQHG